MAFKTYKETDKSSFLHMEFIRDNFSRVISKVKPDVIHHHGTALSAMHYANLKTDIPIIYSPHGIMLINEGNTSEEYQHRFNATKRTLSFADHYTALNESVVKRLSLLGVERRNVSIVPNGVDTKKFYYSEEARKTIRKELSVKDSVFVFIAVGLVIDRKGQLLFLKLLESLGIDYQYWIIGKGPDEAVIQKYIKENRISDKVRLLGYVEDREIYKYHSAADIYALGSSEEAQSLAEIEAYTCGMKIIVNRIISETVIGDIRNDSSRYYVLDFDEIDYESLRKWIMNENWKRTSVRKFDWDEIALQYAGIYDKATSNDTNKHA